MKKIITFFFSILCILSVVNAQDITVFNFDGVTPTTSSWSDTFVSATNPLKTGINTSTNAGLYTHSTQWSSVSTAVNIDSRYYTSYSVDVYSTTGTGTAVVALFDASNKQLDWFSIPISGTAWTRYTRNLYCIGTVASVSVSYNIDQVPSATSANNIVYFDNLVFKEITSSFIPLYIETFYASVSQYGSWSGAPSTQAGNWFGGVNLQTTGDANINLNRLWNGDSHDDNLQINTTDAAVIIPNINVAGFDSLKFSADILRDATSSELPIIDVQIGTGNWISVATSAVSGSWTWGNQIDLLKNADGIAISNVSTISIRLSPSSATGILYDNVKILGKVHVVPVVITPPDVIVFNYDGVNPTGIVLTGEAFASIANPYTTGINASANCGKYSHNSISGDVKITTPSAIDPAVYTTIEYMASAPETGQKVTLSTYTSGGTLLETFTEPVFATAGVWVKYSHTLTNASQIGIVKLTYRNGVALTGQGANRYCYFDNVVFRTAVTALPTAQQIASKMKIGWNLGNTLEVTWGTPGTTTQAAIDSVKRAGFNTVRLPVAWFYHSDTITSTINTTWLASVKKVVDYCINDSMYVIINAHWDTGWLENRVNAANKTTVNTRQNLYWTQIANYFKDYNDHLLFAGSNEPNVADGDAAGMSVLLSYHQTFINAVRATGGNNSSRTLIIQGPSTNIETTNSLMNTMPTDQIANRLIVEIHYYYPWNFCGLNADESWGQMFYYWGSGNHSTTDVTRNSTFGEEADMDNSLNLMKTKFIDQGIPVIVGEYGAFRRTLTAPSSQTLHNASIEYYYRYFMKSAIQKGLIPYCWDTGGIFNFTTGKIVDSVVEKAIMQGVQDATGVVTGTNVLNDNTLELYPNPFTSTINLKIDNPDDIDRITVFDIMGRQVENIGHSTIKNSLTIGSTLKPDMYIVCVYGKNWLKTFKVVKK